MNDTEGEYAALLQTADAITTKYNNASTGLVALQRENEVLRKALEVIAQDIGSTHAATKARDALKAIVGTKDGT